MLVIRLGALGDVTNALALAGALKRERPDVHIGWAAHDLVLPLLVGHPWVDRVHHWPRARKFAGALDVAREARAEGYDLVVDLQRILKSALLSRLVRAPRTLGYDRGRAKEQSWRLHRERIAPGDPQAPMILQAMEFAQHLGCRDLEPLRELPRDADAEGWADSLLARLGAAPIAVNLGASKPPNRWLPERFAELARAIAALEAGPVLLTGGPEDRELFAPALEAADGDRIHDLVGRTSIPQMIALSRRLRLYVGCDTGPTHVAAAVGIPCVALFGPADPRRTGPFGSQHRVVSVPADSPSRAMADLSVASALDAVEERLRQQ
ncbi:MAG: glycosyltransferase family 9 protein [Planctomycetota bacterium]